MTDQDSVPFLFHCSSIVFSFRYIHAHHLFTTVHFIFIFSILLVHSFIWFHVCSILPFPQFVAFPFVAVHWFSSAPFVWVRFQLHLHSFIRWFHFHHSTIHFIHHLPFVHSFYSLSCPLHPITFQVGACWGKWFHPNPFNRHRCSMRL